MGKVAATRGVQYGENLSYANDPVPLRMDVFGPPRADTGWPLLILLGRAFPEPQDLDSVDNPKYSSEFITAIAEHGIVVAAIDIDQELRASQAIPSDVGIAWRTVRAIQDAKAAVRFFRSDAATANRYGIDPQRIFLGGHSVMGTLSGITVYLDEPAKWGAKFEEISARYGGLEGAAGNPGYDSSVSAWVGLAGALRVEDLDWIGPSSRPMLVVYPTNDETMPTDRKTMTMLSLRSEWAGAISLYDRAISVGLTASEIYAIDGGDHYSAIDPSNTELITRIVRFLLSNRHQPSARASATG